MSTNVRKNSAKKGTKKPVTPHAEAEGTTPRAKKPEQGAKPEQGTRAKATEQGKTSRTRKPEQQSKELKTQKATKKPQAKSTQKKASKEIKKKLEDVKADEDKNNEPEDVGELVKPWLTVWTATKLRNKVAAVRDRLKERQEAELSFVHKHAFHTGMEIIRTMCCTDDGDVIVCGRIDTRRAEKQIEDPTDAYEIHWYNMKGELQQKIPHAPDCKHYSVGVLHMIIEGEIYIAISCYLCKSICLYNPGEDTHITAFQQEGIEPGEICHGESGEIYVQSRQKVVILDTTTTEFKFKSEVDVKMKRADYISYINLGDRGAAVATTEGYPFFRLNVTEIIISVNDDNDGRPLITGVESKEVLYTVGGKNEEDERTEVAGVLWRPIGVCNDGKHMYVADMWGKRLVIIDVSTGEVIQAVAPPDAESISVATWCEEQNRLIVQHERNGTCYISFFELGQP